jgi:hypothetical protein
MFHLFQTYVAYVLIWMLHMFYTYVATVWSKYFICFSLILQTSVFMLQVTSVFMLQVASVLSGYCISFTHVASVCYWCFIYFRCMLYLSFFHVARVSRCSESQGEWRVMVARHGRRGMGRWVGSQRTWHVGDRRTGRNTVGCACEEGQTVRQMGRPGRIEADGTDCTCEASRSDAQAQRQ